MLSNTSIIHKYFNIYQNMILYLADDNACAVYLKFNLTFFLMEINFFFCNIQNIWIIYKIVMDLARMIYLTTLITLTYDITSTSHLIIARLGFSRKLFATHWSSFYRFFVNAAWWCTCKSLLKVPMVNHNKYYKDDVKRETAHFHKKCTTFHVLIPWSSPSQFLMFVFASETY